MYVIEFQLCFKEEAVGFTDGLDESIGGKKNQGWAERLNSAVIYQTRNTGKFGREIKSSFL